MHRAAYYDCSARCAVLYRRQRSTPVPRAGCIMYVFCIYAPANTRGCAICKVSRGMPTWHLLGWCNRRMHACWTVNKANFRHRDRTSILRFLYFYFNGFTGYEPTLSVQNECSGCSFLLWQLNKILFWFLKNVLSLLS